MNPIIAKINPRTALIFIVVVLMLCVCFRHLGSQLAELERAIEKMMEADFVHFAMEDIHHRLPPSTLRKDGIMQPASSEGESSEVITKNEWILILFYHFPELSLILLSSCRRSS